MNKIYVSLIFPILAIIGMGIPLMKSGSRFYEQAGTSVIVISGIILIMLLYFLPKIETNKVSQNGKTHK